MSLMRETLEKNQFKRLLVGRNLVEISIFQYTDDTIFFGESSMQNLRAIKAMLRSFEMALGLKINFSKSQYGGDWNINGVDEGCCLIP